jgi:hypothetical protein
VKAVVIHAPGAVDPAKIRGVLIAPDLETLLPGLDDTPSLCVLCASHGTVGRLFLDSNGRHGVVAAVRTCRPCATRVDAIREAVRFAIDGVRAVSQVPQ